MIWHEAMHSFHNTEPHNFIFQCHLLTAVVLKGRKAYAVATASDIKEADGSRTPAEFIGL